MVFILSASRFWGGLKNTHPFHLEINMNWRANLSTYEKQTHPSNKNLKHYRAILICGATGKLQVRTSKRKFSTANGTLSYAYRFNHRIVREASRPYQDKMGSGYVEKMKWSLASVINRLQFTKRLEMKSDLIAPRDTLLFDVSLYQRVIDFLKMKLFPSDGVIIKAGQHGYKDPYFDSNWVAAKAQGLPRGDYFFYDSRMEPKAQARVWWNIIKGDPGELKHWVDYEEHYGGAYAGWRNLKLFIEEFLRVSGLSVNDVGIYTGYYYWIANSPTTTADLAWFGQFWLWLAWYTDNPANVLIPRPWTQQKVILWQQGTPSWGLQAGVATIEIDADYFVRPRSEYKTFFNLGGTLPTDPPTQEIDMTTFNALRVNAVALNGRSSPAGTIIFPGGFLKNDILLAKDSVLDVNGVSKWYPVFAAIRAGSIVPLPATVVFAGDGGSNNYMTRLTSVETAEDLTKYPEITLTLEADAGYPPAEIVWKPNP
jgi:GH25 family lysozyme M1 (1,4-beta-N-acetylmuramidase)